MGFTKFIFYIVTFLFIAFPIGIGTTEAVELAPEYIEKEPQYLNREELHHVDSVLHRRLEINGFRGTALVAYKGQILMTYANGYSNYRTKDKIEVASSFQLASVSKSFTATAVMLLKDQGKLSFQDTVTKFIPEFPYEDITVKQLLQHTAGLQNYMYLVDNYWDNDSLISNEDILNLLIKHDLPLNNRPGRKFIYSNTGYAILALLVERVSGQDFNEFLAEEVFKPAKMNHTFTYSHDIMDTLGNRVMGYNRKGRRLYRYDFEPNDMVLGDKSVYSNVVDLFNYQRALNDGQLVKSETLEEAYTKGKTNSRYSRSFNYGYGWRFKNDNGRNLIYHNGLWHGFSTTLTREIDHDITVVLLNNTTASISSIRNDLINLSISELSKFDLQPDEIDPIEPKRLQALDI
ncbi:MULTISPECIES: serine hydrolase [unclassified Lentimicrobium]|uniref:serine hydrolase domain-containing protein n=1 Tax=unclassified Lentimicrobium TaxID=2677434 RepID=UPI0015566AB6|nr:MULTISPECIES: serine hydrolase domain-containing protein [unclassified Lentimicrobium]NPD46593.1 beta-lactamase family protein [Lentimicrobium sp. S6]NPD83812.1 beta-lactamase family protein [Lentimicrobium sp. L6]